MNDHAVPGTPVAHDQRRIAILAIVGVHALGIVALTSCLLSTSAGVHNGILATAVTAYALGVRHAFDADHVAAIDTATRRLAHHDKPSLTVGLWFSLGHSSVVIAMCVALVASIRTFGTVVTDEHSPLRELGRSVGLGFSAAFLLALGLLNAVQLLRRRPTVPNSLGGRVSGRVGSAVSTPGRMYVVGILFGFGFDTATEIGLLSLTIAAVIGSSATLFVLALPVLFAAGMSTFDTVQGALTRTALNSPRRRISYSALVTAASCLIAIVVGIVELCQLVSGITGPSPLLASIGNIDVSTLGLWLTGLILLVLVVRIVTRKPAQ